ncbi:MAG: hypothetical protein CL867_04255 [Cytophagaceae bacterium]|nr:hypothetical protein [Cytophagaceae bacterium]
MTKFFLILFLVAGCLSGIAQNTFEAGSYTDNQDQVYQGYIKNMDWLGNPSSIRFKLNDQSEEIELKVAQIKSFEIKGVSKYERYTIEVDQSSDNLNTLSEKRAPEFEQETVLLQLIASGHINLYEYSNENTFLYYYSKDGATPTPLIYKPYTVANKSGLKYNNRYKQQLSQFACVNGTPPKADNLRYKKKDLMRFIDMINDCNNNRVTRLSKAEQKTRINFRALAGITSASSKAAIRNRLYSFPNEINTTFGLEIEAVLPFNNNKWSLFAGLQTLTYEAELGSDQVNFSALDFNFGGRHYMFINSNNSIFVNASAGFEVSTNYEILYNNRPAPLVNKTPSASFEFGLGYAYKRWSAEVRYITERNHLGETFIDNNSKYTAFMLNLGYKFLSL